MEEERLIILKLLEQRKITESEAERLLDALGDIEYDQATQNNSDALNQYRINLSKDNDNTYNEDENIKNDTDPDKNNSFEDILESMGKKFEDLGEQLEDKIDVFGEHFGKKIIDLGAIFADKSINIAEKVIDAVGKAVDSGSFSDTFSNLDLFGGVKSYEEVLEKKLSDIGQASLKFEGYNGNISISQWDKPIIKATAHISAKESKYDSNKPIFELKEDNNILHFFCKQVDWIGVKLDIQLPKQVYNLIKIQNRNGHIFVENLECNNLSLQTKNGSIKISNVKVETEASYTTTNNKIIIEDSSAESLLVATKNGKIHISSCGFNKIEGITSNGKITIRDINFNLLQSMSLKTTNAKIEMFGNLPEDIGVQFNASTTHGSINISLPLVYVENVKNYSSHRINARTASFDKCQNIVFIKAYTTNSSIYFYN